MSDVKDERANADADRIRPTITIGMTSRMMEGILGEEERNTEEY